MQFGPRRVLLCIVALFLLAAPLGAALAQNGAEGEADAPAAASNGQSAAPVAERDVVALGRGLFERLKPIVAERLYDEEDGPCAPVNGMPRCFDPDFARTSAFQPVAVAAAVDARVLALEIIEAYAALVSAVSEGDADAVLGTQKSSLIAALNQAGVFGAVVETAKGVIDATAPVPDFVTDLGFAGMSRLVSLFAASQSAADTSDALIASAPVVDALIVALIDETPWIYEQYRLGRNEEIIRLENELVVKGFDESADTGAIEDEIEAVKSDVREFYGGLRLYVLILEQRRNAMKVLTRVAVNAAQSPTPVLSESALDKVKVAAGLLLRLRDLATAIER